MFRSRWLLLLVLAVLPVLGCSSGNECDTCSSDADCKDGFMCVNFRNEDTGELVGKRCGSGQGATQCRVR